MTVISQLAEFVAQANVAALPDAEQTLQRRHILDAVVAAAVGARTGEARSLAALLGARALPEIIGQRAATIRLSEVDDIHLPSCTTPSAAAVAVALSLAAQAGRFDPVQVASAIWAGTETMTRMGEAVRGPEILYRGVWPSCFAAPLSAAATAARMHGFDAQQTAHALSLALMLSTRGTGRPHGSPSARWVMFALAVACGLSAVEAVQAGYRGDPGLLDGSGFEDSWGFALDRDQLAAASLAHSVYPALSMKPFCSAKQSIAAVEALRTILASGIEPASDRGRPGAGAARLCRDGRPQGARPGAHHDPGQRRPPARAAGLRSGAPLRCRSRHGGHGSGAPGFRGQGGDRGRRGADAVLSA